MRKFTKIIALVIAAVIAMAAIFACSKGEKDGTTGEAEPTVDPVAAIFLSASVGDYVTFGKYEQDNDLTNGKEDIEWLVLAKEEGKMLLISRFVLDCQPYNIEFTTVTWEMCTLRKWLNETFINDAFGESEQKIIQTTTVWTADDPFYDTEEGKYTYDKIFLLKGPETDKYFNDDNERMCAPTDYAIAKGVDTDDSYKTGGRAACWWWLREPGYDLYDAVNVAPSGYTSSNCVYGYGASYPNYGVRPAMWVELPAAVPDSTEDPTGNSTTPPKTEPASEPTAGLTVDPLVSGFLSASVGDYVTFGRFEQDDDLTNGKEDIEWLVLAKEGTKVLVISRYGLDAQPFNTENKDVTWETCTLRKWLNETFLNNAFNDDEKKFVQTASVRAEDNPYYRTDAGSNTNDKIFLLSISEAEKYLASNKARMCSPTDYAVSQGVWTDASKKTDGRAACRWWLRSPGNYSDSASYVDAGGLADYRGYYVFDDYNAVRPAMWIQISD